MVEYEEVRTIDFQDDGGGRKRIRKERWRRYKSRIKRKKMTKGEEQPKKFKKERKVKKERQRKKAKGRKKKGC